MAGTLTTSPRIQAVRRILARAHHRRRPWLSQTDLIRAMLREIGKAGAVHSDVYDLRADRDGALAALGYWVPRSRNLRARRGGPKVPHYCLAKLGEPPPEPPAWMTGAAEPAATPGLLGRAAALLPGWLRPTA